MVCRLPYFAARLLKYAVVAAVLESSFTESSILPCGYT